MKSTLGAISAKDKEALALLYDTEGFQALKRLLQAEINHFAKDALQAPSMEVLAEYKGQAKFAKDLPVAIQTIYRQVNKSADSA